MNRDGIDSKTLLVIAGRLGNDWKTLAIHLGFENEDISDFEVNNPGNVQQQRFNMLTKWRQSQPSTEGQMGVLCRALKDIKRNDIVILLQGRIRRPNEISGPTPSETCQQQPTRHYKETTNTIHAPTLGPTRPVAMGGFHSNFGLTQGMYTLAQIPIIILLLCTVWEYLSKLLGRLTELYTYFAKVLVSRRCNEGIPAHPLDSSRTLAMVGFGDLERTQGLKVPIKTDVARKGCKDNAMTDILWTYVTSLCKTQGVGYELEKVFVCLNSCDVELVQIKSGSVTFVVHVISQEGLNKLWSMYTTGELAKKLTEILITNELTTEDKSDLAIQVTIQESDYEQACIFFEGLENDQKKDEEDSSSMINVQREQLEESMRSTVTAYSSNPTEHAADRCEEILYMTRVGIEDHTLLDISGMLGDEWKELAIHLGFDEAKISTFEVNNPSDVRHQKVQMLTEWRRRQPSTEGQMDVLCRALQKINRINIVVRLQGSTRLAGLTPLMYCQQRLAEHYEQTSIIPAHPFDPSRTVAMGRFYFDLELTRRVKGKPTSLVEAARLRGETRILDTVRTVQLDSWEDMLNIDTEEGESLKIIVSGGAGFGKSTLLLRVANASIDPKAIMAKFKLVFLVLLKKMRQSSCVLKAIWDQIFPKNTQLRKADLKKVIDDNEAETLILLDGLDEIPCSVLNSPAKEGEYGVKDIFENKVLVKSCVIVTTRPHMIDYALEKYPHFARVQTHGFTLNTANRYIAEYFAEKVSLGDKLKSNLESNESLQTLTQIPILVLLMCIVWENLSKMPDRLTELYTQFAKAVVSQRCNKGEDQSELMKSILPRLGRVALDGLLDPKGERLMFSSEEFDEKDLEEGCRLGFLQQDSSVSGLKIINLVTFLHKSFQKYSAAHYLASLYFLVGKRRFHDELKRINAGNVLAMRDLLRFTCGISSESPTTGFILDHVRKQTRGYRNTEELELQDLERMLLYESSSSKWAGKLERPRLLSLRDNPDLKALHYYLQCVPRPPVKIEEFTVKCLSHVDITIWRDILLSGKITPTIGPYTRFMDGSLPFWSCRYTMADRVSDAMQTLDETIVRMDERIRDRLMLHLTIDKNSCLEDERVLGYLPFVSYHVIRVNVYGRSYNDVSRLTNALRGCSRLWWVELHDTNLHNNLQCLASLINPSLRWLILERCGMDDDDIHDLIRIIPARHGRLFKLDVKGNAFSVDGLETLCAHLQSLPSPDLRFFHVGYTGPNEESVKSMVRQYLPNVRLT